MSRAWILVVLLPAVFALGAPSEPRATDPPVLHVEDVVRWHVAGVAPGEIVARIQASAVDFDLSDEMVEELRLAGLPDTVLVAMRERQAALHPAAPPPVAEPSPEATSALVLHVHGAKPDEPARLSLPTRVPSEIATRLSIEDPAPVVTGIALYAACLRATHVPSHWRAESPLGRDFATMPRHEMLLFVPLEPLESQAPKASDSRLAVEAPAKLEIPLDPADTHDLDLGIAVRIGERYYRMDSDTWSAFALADHADGLEAQVGSGTSGLRVRFVRPG